MKHDRKKYNYYCKLSRMLIKVPQDITDHEITLNLLYHLDDDSL